MNDEAEQPDDGARRLLRLIDSHAIQIMEHCDSVQIITTVYDPIEGTSQMVSCGKGNWYTRTGSVREWLKDNR
jgi:hypothetical protein